MGNSYAKCAWLVDAIDEEVLLFEIEQFACKEVMHHHQLYVKASDRWLDDQSCMVLLALMKNFCHPNFLHYKYGLLSCMVKKQ